MKKPWSKFYWSDWRNEMTLKACSLASRGFWMEMLAIMSVSEKYGYLQIGGQPITMKQLACMAGCTEDEAVSHFEELKRNTVFSIGEDGIPYSRRMVREHEAYIAGVEHGRQGGNPDLISEKLKNTKKLKKLEQGIRAGDNPPPYPNAESKQPYGEFGHVKLSESEHTKLLQKHGEIKLNKGITVLDDYIEARGKRYHNHYAVLKEGSWVWERIGQAPGRTSTASDTINRRKVYEDMQAELAELRSRRWDDDAKQRYPDKWARYHELKDKVAKLKREFEAAIT